MEWKNKTLEQCIIGCGQHPAALEQIYLLLKRDVFSVSYCLLRDFSLAEDAVQETFVRLPRASKKFSGISGGKSFVLKIARNVSMEFLRKNKRMEVADLDGNLPPSEDFTQQVDLRQVLAFLDPKLAEIIALHVFASLTFRESAKITHVPASTLKSRYQRALTVLRNCLQEGELCGSLNTGTKK